MPIDETSPLFALLADWIKVLLTLPDPPPEQLTTVSEVVVLTAISILSQRLSDEAGGQLRSAVATALQKASARSTAAGR